MSRLLPVRRSGFALLLTLMVLALAAVILSLSARRSTTATRSALQAERDLRQKWAMDAGEILLEQADNLLVNPAAGDAAQARRLPARKFDLTMAGQRVVVLLANEQAKPNLNTLAQRLPTSDIARLVEALGGKDPVAGVDADRPFWCLEQLRPGSTPSDLLGAPWPDPARASLATAATLVGDGKLDWRIASPAALVAVLGPEIASDKAQALVSVQQEALPEAAVAQVTARWTSKEKQTLQARTTLKPQAWSAWVAVGPTQAEARPVCYRFTLLERKDDRPIWRRQEWNPTP